MKNTLPLMYLLQYHIARESLEKKRLETSYTSSYMTRVRLGSGDTAKKCWCETNIPIIPF